MLWCGIFAVAQVLALCPRVNIAVMISWDILGLQKKKILTIISFYSVCCICIAINVVYILPPSGTEKKKAWRQRARGLNLNHR